MDRLAAATLMNQVPMTPSVDMQELYGRAYDLGYDEAGGQVKSLQDQCSDQQLVIVDLRGRVEDLTASIAIRRNERDEARESAGSYARSANELGGQVAHLESILRGEGFTLDDHGAWHPPLADELSKTAKAALEANHNLVDANFKLDAENAALLTRIAELEAKLPPQPTDPPIPAAVVDEPFAAPTDPAVETSPPERTEEAPTP